MKKSFYSYSFGCRVNQAEIEAINSELMKRGFTYDKETPSLFILNTCSVTQRAEREARALILRTRREYPDIKIVVTGCAGTNWIKTNTKVKQVDYIIDNKNKEFVADLIGKKYFQKEVSNVNLLSPKIDKEYSETDKFLDSKRVIVKIQDGCHRFCTYCIVPYLRGLPKSKKINEVISKINEHKNYKEAVLTAINTEAFGFDTKEKFNDLITLVLEKTEISRISFGSIHPWTLNDDFFELYKKKLSHSNRFVDFFHIPLQSGCNKILRLMKRDYTKEEIMTKLQTITSINKFAFIGTDIIVGFLEESDNDFEETFNFLEKTPISKFHVFRYSKREHTASFYLGKRLSEPSDSTKKARSLKLRELSDKKFYEFQQKHTGKVFEALFLRRHSNSKQQAVLTNNMSVFVKTQKDETGNKKNVRILETKDGILLGDIV